MPVSTPQLSKLTLRQALSPRVRDWFPITTTSAGNGGGTTGVSSQISTYGADLTNDFYFLCIESTNAGEFRIGSDLTSGTWTVSQAYTAQVASGIDFEAHRFPPNLYTLALNQAKDKLYPSVHKLEQDIIPVVDRRQDWYATPRTGISTTVPHRVHRVLQGGRLLREDLFTRADSAASIGGAWVQDVGTAGITSHQGYFVSNANGDRIRQALSIENGVVSARLKGTIDSGTDYDVLSLIFRYGDSSNYLVARVFNNLVQLRRVDGGTETNLLSVTATVNNDVWYTLRVVFQGSLVRVYVDDDLLINHQLTGRADRYEAFGDVAVRQDKGGSPANAARIDDYRAYEIGPWVEHHDWEQSPDWRELRFGLLGNRSGITRDLLLVEGSAPLTSLDADTTFNALTNDTTAVFEVTADDPAREVLLEQAAAELLSLLMGFWGDAEDRAEFERERARHQAQADRLLADGHGMRLPARALRRAY